MSNTQLYKFLTYNITMETLGTLSKKVKKLEDNVESLNASYSNNSSNSQEKFRLEESVEEFKKNDTNIDFKIKIMEEQLLALKEFIHKQEDIDSMEILSNTSSMKKFNSSKEDIERDDVEKVSNFDDLLK